MPLQLPDERRPPRTRHTRVNGETLNLAAAALTGTNPPPSLPSKLCGCPLPGTFAPELCREAQQQLCAVGAGGLDCSCDCHTREAGQAASGESDDWETDPKQYGVDAQAGQGELFA